MPPCDWIIPEAGKPGAPPGLCIGMFIVTVRAGNTPGIVGGVSGEYDGRIKGGRARP
jgi:hypothetical protein